MRIEVGNKVDAVTEAQAATGRRELAEVLNRWWSQKSETPEIVDVSWGKFDCQIKLSIDQAKSPQITYAPSLPPSIREAVKTFLVDTCHVAAVDDHFRNETIQERIKETLTNKVSEQDMDDVGAPLARFRSGSVTQFGMFKRPATSNAPKQAPTAPEPVKDKGGPAPK